MKKFVQVQVLSRPPLNSILPDFTKPQTFGCAQFRKLISQKNQVKASATREKMRIIGLTLAAIYLPYSFVFLSGVSFNFVTGVLVWLSFPGLAFSALVNIQGFISPVGVVSPILCGVFIVGGSLFATLRFKQYLWPILGALALASCGLVYIMLQLYRA